MLAKKPNHLINEKSPYLLEHAYNPVDWYPWGTEAFERAKKEDKPVFLSIGYSACHWCHVMERECFEDEDVAEILNRSFVAVKVDREERPDVDAVYMDVCQAMTGSGGWPMTILMTPEQKPFFAATYLPKEGDGRLYGLMDVLGAIEMQWQQDKDQLVESGQKVADFLLDRRENAPAKREEDLLREAREYFGHQFDREYGGFGTAPKFPAAHNLIFLLRYGAVKRDSEAVDMAAQTLEHMYRGGLFDHVGFGFSRYSTDRKWLIHHFEKMLYDNALLAMALLEAGKFTGNDLFYRVARRTLLYLQREMTGKEGGFFCSQDADSEGVEGKYYVFSPEEMIHVFGEQDGARFNSYFGLTRDGNYRGMNIPNRIHAQRADELDPQMEEIVRKVYEYRLQRFPLNRDDKVLTSWNALAAAAFAMAYRVLGDAGFLETAEKAMRFARERLTKPDGSLMVRWRDGEAKGEGFFDDYAYTAFAYLLLYDATLSAEHLQRALGCCAQIDARFADEENGGYFLYGKDSEQLIVRPKEVFDSAFPSGNSVAGYVMIRLSELTGDEGMRKKALRQLSFLSGAVSDFPGGASFALTAMMRKLSPGAQAVCAARDEEDARRFLEFVRTGLPLGACVLLKTPENGGLLGKIAPFTREYGLKDGQTAYYLCRNRTCSAPVSNLEQFRRMCAVL